MSFTVQSVTDREVGHAEPETRLLTTQCISCDYHHVTPLLTPIYRRTDNLAGELTNTAARLGVNSNKPL